VARGLRRTAGCSPSQSEFSSVDKTLRHNIKLISPLSTTTTRGTLDKKLSVPPSFLEESPSIAEAESLLPPLNSVIFEPDLVIFDKDGTLVCFHTMWNSWCEEFAQRVTQATQKDLQDSVYQAMGYDGEKREVRLGMLAEKTNPYIRKKMVELLRYHLVEDAAQVVEKTWQDTPEDMQIRLMGDMRSLFGRLKAKNIKIAICTADSREGTVQFLERMGLVSMVDCLVCGDDPFSKPKPDKHNALHICAELGVEPHNAIMVGDTPADTIMGQAANLGLTIGVLTGIGNKEDLTHADIIVHNVDEVVDLITPMYKDNTYVMKEFHSIRVTTRGLYKIAKRSALLHGNTSNN